MRTVHVEPPSFPEVEPDALLDVKPDKQWQVVCGDADHWRAGVYSPAQTGPADLDELEVHTCPELFLLIEGNITLLLALDGEVEQLLLEPGKPILVTAPHAGFCPDGPHTGRAFIVERDVFSTEYRAPDEWMLSTRPG